MNADDVGPSDPNPDIGPVTGPMNADDVDLVTRTRTLAQ